MIFGHFPVVYRVECFVRGTRGMPLKQTYIVTDENRLGAYEIAKGYFFL